MSIQVTKGEAIIVESCNGCLRPGEQVLEIMIGRQSGDTFTGSATRLCNACAKELLTKLQQEVK